MNSKCIVLHRAAKCNRCDTPRAAYIISSNIDYSIWTRITMWWQQCNRVRNVLQYLHVDFRSMRPLLMSCYTWYHAVNSSLHLTHASIEVTSRDFDQWMRKLLSKCDGGNTAIHRDLCSFHALFINILLSGKLKILYLWERVFKVECLSLIRCNAISRYIL